MIISGNLLDFITSCFTKNLYLVMDLEAGGVMITGQLKNDKQFILLIFSLLTVLALQLFTIMPGYSIPAAQNTFITSDRIANIAEALSPSVVSIQTESEEVVEYDLRNLPFGEGYNS